MPCNNCGTPIHIEEFLASLIRVDSSGNVGINVTLIPIADCTDLSSPISCGSTYDLTELIKSACTLDSCDNPSINVFYETT